MLSQAAQIELVIRIGRKTEETTISQSMSQSTIRNTVAAGTMMIDATKRTIEGTSLETKETTTVGTSARRTRAVAVSTVEGRAMTKVTGRDIIDAEMVRKVMCIMRGVREINMMKVVPKLHILLFLT